jgi:hypothetical protein
MPVWAILKMLSQTGQALRTKPTIHIMAKNNTPPNGPSKSGNLSGGGRGNNPPKGK